MTTRISRWNRFTLKSALAVTLSAGLLCEPLRAIAPMTAFPLPIRLSPSLGEVSETFDPAHSNSPAAPQFILIQNLHVNRSVQFTLSKILASLKEQGLLPATLAVEGATGLMDTAAMQAFPDQSVRRRTSDYLVQQGEMPGAMHFVVSEGEGNLFGVETADVYEANLESYRVSFENRLRLLSALDRIQTGYLKLKNSKATRDAAIQLERDVTTVRQLLQFQVIPNELGQVLRANAGAVERLRALLPVDVAAVLIPTLSASTHFYAFARMRDEDLLKNSLSLRTQEHQTTTVLITGGFHTAGIAQGLRKAGLSYVVITPAVARHTSQDEKLYTERLLGRHLTPDQVSHGMDWAAFMLEPVYGAVQPLFRSAYTFFGSNRTPLRRLGQTGILALMMVQNAMAAFIPGVVAPAPLPTRDAHVLYVAPPTPAQSQALRPSIQWILERQRISGSALVRSFEVPQAIDQALRRVDAGSQAFLARGFANTYDQALAGLVAVHTGNEKRALEIITEFADRGTVPGRSNFEAEQISGEIAWLGILAADYVRTFGPDASAAKLMEMVDEYLGVMQQTDGRIKGGPNVPWTSAEHNISVLAYWSKRHHLTRSPKIQQQRLRVARWLATHAYLPDEKRLRRGQNDNVFATDVQAWGAMLFSTLKAQDAAFYNASGSSRIDIGGLLHSIEERAADQQDYESISGQRVAGVAGYRYGDTGPITVEWTYEVAEAYRRSGNPRRAAQISAAIARVKSPQGTFPYALAPGKTFSDGGWTATRFPSIASTAAHVLYTLGVNYFGVSSAGTTGVQVPVDPNVSAAPSVETPARPAEQASAQADRPAQAGWQTLSQGPRSAPWTDGRAFSVWEDGDFNFSRVRTIRLTFSPNQAGTKFRLRLLPEGASPNQPTGLRQEILTIPANGVVILPFDPAEFALDLRAVRAIIQLNVLSGDNTWNSSLGQPASRHAIFNRIEVSESSVVAVPRGSSPAAVSAQEPASWQVLPGSAQMWTDNRAYSSYVDGKFDLSNVSALRVTFSRSDAGTKFRLRLLPKGANPGNPIGVSEQTFTIPSSGVLEIPLSAAGFGLGVSQLRDLAQITAMSGDNTWNNPLGQAASRRANILQIEVRRTGRREARERLEESALTLSAAGRRVLSGLAMITGAVTLNAALAITVLSQETKNPPMLLPFHLTNLPGAFSTMGIAALIGSVFILALGSFVVYVQANKKMIAEVRALLEREGFGKSGSGFSGSLQAMISVYRGEVSLTASAEDRLEEERKRIGMLALMAAA